MCGSKSSGSSYIHTLNIGIEHGDSILLLIHCISSGINFRFWSFSMVYLISSSPICFLKLGDSWKSWCSNGTKLLLWLKGVMWCNFFCEDIDVKILSLRELIRNWLWPWLDESFMNDLPGREESRYNCSPFPLVLISMHLKIPLERDLPGREESRYNCPPFPLVLICACLKILWETDLPGREEGCLGYLSLK